MRDNFPCLRAASGRKHSLPDTRGGGESSMAGRADGKYWQTRRENGGQNTPITNYYLILGKFHTYIERE